ncbi:MAG: alpha-glucosidase MalA [Thermoproteus sp.]
MKILAESDGEVLRLRINDPAPLMDIPFSGKPAEPPPELSIAEGEFPFRLEAYAGLKGLVLSRPLSLDEHVYGLGEKAFDLDRRRGFFQLWNVDVGCVARYGWYVDPMYVSVPFLIVFDAAKATGYFINSASRIFVDAGLYRYDRLTVFVPEDSVELFVIGGPKIEDVLRRYFRLTGMPFLMPEWALGYQISRYSYYPQERVVEVVRRHVEMGVPVSAVYLDIDYMDGYKAFTWDPQKFPSPRQLAEELHKMGARLVTILNPVLKVDQRYPVFREALGLFVETKNGEIYTGAMWPGKSAWIDFLKPEARSWWAERVRRWAEEWGVDGIWLDMNEPTALGEPQRDCALDPEALHDAGGRRVRHAEAHNYYSVFQAEATFRGLAEAGREPFILSRAGSAGIQRYAAVWTGDNAPSWEDLRLQTAIVLGLSVSGVPYAGFDIGSFAGHRHYKSPYVNDMDLLVRYYQIALFFPLFRSHRAPDTPDREIYELPDRWREKVVRVVRLRYRFLPYLSALSLEAHEEGRPILRPLAYYHQDDENVHAMYDEYYVGPYILYAPLLWKEAKRPIYLPRGRWADFWTGEIHEGPVWVENSDELPIYVREGAVVPLASDNGLDVLVFGDGGRIKLRDGTVIQRDGGVLALSKPKRVDKVVEYRGGRIREIAVGSFTDRVVI